MRSPDIVIRAADRLPIVVRTVTVDSVAVNLTGYDGLFYVAPITGGTNLLTVPTATIDPDQTNNTGVIRYTFTAADASALVAGVYACWFEVTNAGQTLSAPNDGFLVLQVIADAAGVFTYSGNPSARPLDMVRYLIRDIDSATPKMSDAEIAAELTMANDSIFYAAASCAETIAAVAAVNAQVQSKTVGDLSVSYNWQAQSEAYTALATRLRARAARTGSISFVSGSTDDTDRIFRIGITDQPPGIDTYDDLTQTSLAWGP